MKQNLRIKLTPAFILNKQSFLLLTLNQMISLPKETSKCKGPVNDVRGRIMFEEMLRKMRKT